MYFATSAKAFLLLNVGAERSGLKTLEPNGRSTAMLFRTKIKKGFRLVISPFCQRIVSALNAPNPVCRPRCSLYLNASIFLPLAKPKRISPLQHTEARIYAMVSPIVYLEPLLLK